MLHEKQIDSCFPRSAVFGVTPRDVTLTSYVGTLSWPVSEPTPQNKRVRTANLTSWVNELDVGWYDLRIADEAHHMSTRWHTVHVPAQTYRLNQLVHSACDLRPDEGVSLTLHARQRNAPISDVKLLF